MVRKLQEMYTSTDWTMNITRCEYLSSRQQISKQCKTFDGENKKNGKDH